MLDNDASPIPARSIAVERLVTHQGSTELTGHCPDGLVRATVPATADERLTKRYLGTVRRVDRVVIHFEDGVVSSQAIGRRGRLPFRSPIKLSVALGLAQTGAPTTLTGIVG